MIMALSKCINKIALVLFLNNINLQISYFYPLKYIKNNFYGVIMVLDMFSTLIE